MAGIYVHVPFCKKKCHYCDFYSTTNSEITGEFIFSLKEEINLRKHYLHKESIKSIYFGGGSPSMLSINQVQGVMDTLRDNFDISSSAEITFECNPDDLDITYCEELRGLGINRISIGIQSFDDETLKFLNRRHTAKKGEEAIDFAKESGFNDISVDIMFGIPGMDNEVYRKTIGRVLNHQVHHISAYHLSIEPRTVLYRKLEKGSFSVVDEDASLYQFDLTIERLKERGYRHYEVSNYALEGHESKHNWLYWSNEKYLGLGPSAHSYDGNSRQWNIDSTKKYIELIRDGAVFFGREELSVKDKYNEYILTSLRTCKGLSDVYVKKEFEDRIFEHFGKVLYRTVKEGFIERFDKESWALNKKGLFIMDSIIREFYYV